MISIIVPVKNQVVLLKQTLSSLVPEKGGHEVIVVDRGSVDGAEESLRTMPWVRLIKTEAQGNQGLNEASLKAKGDILLFLEPGVWLERGWPAFVEEAAEKPGFKVGCFRLSIGGKNPLYRLIEWTSTMRTFLFKAARGSQALFVRADLAGGQPLFAEDTSHADFELCKRYGEEGAVTQIRRAAVHSGDRWSGPGVCRRFCSDAGTFWSWQQGGSSPLNGHQSGSGRNAVIMLLDRPEARRSDTWLDDAVGADRSAQIYRENVEHILNSIKGSSGETDTLIFYQPEAAREEMVRWLGDRATLIPQHGKTRTVGRLADVGSHFDREYRKIIVLWSQCPALSKSEIKRAVDALDDNEIVIGPTDDGGCYLIGVKKFDPEFFQDLDWSQQDMYKEVLQRAKAQRVAFESLPPLRDFDSLEDFSYNYALGYVQ
jgi:glycosyltransferase A (GT-A) superfamily protein (DUF2064 family)